MDQPLPSASTPMRSVLEARAALLLKAGIATAREARPDDPTLVLMTDGLAHALQASAAEGLEFGLSHELIDEALAATAGWLIASAPDAPMASDAVLRIERFIKLTLRAAEAMREARHASAPVLQGAA